MAGGSTLGEKYRDQISRCSRCGFCQVSCPVYGATLRPAVNPRGKMLILKELLAGRLDLRPGPAGSFLSVYPLRQLRLELSRRG